MKCPGNKSPYSRIFPPTFPPPLLHPCRYCLKWMLDTVFSREEVQEKCSNGGWSAKELDTIFSIKASTVMSEEEENMRESEIAEEVTLWSNTFRKLIEHCSLAFLGQGTYVSSQQRKLPSSSTTAAPKQDKLYKIFQQILNIKSLEHQVLYRECQVRGVVYPDGCGLEHQVLYRECEGWGLVKTGCGLVQLSGTPVV